jgi:hypothetical protein
MRNIDRSALAAHIDGSRLSNGIHKIVISSEHLLLPPSISVTTVIPHPIIVTITGGET